MSTNMNFDVTSKEAINNELEKLNDFSKIYYLERLVKERKDITVKKYCYNKLAMMYLEKGMHSKAADNMEGVARLALSMDEKVKAFMDGIKMIIDGNDYVRAEGLFEKLIAMVNTTKKIELRKQLINIYRQRAQSLEKVMKRGAALLVWERIFKIGDEIDRREAREKLLVLYPILGKISEYNRMKGLN